MSDKSAFWICCYWVFHLFLTGFPAVFNLESIEKTLLLFKSVLAAKKMECDVFDWSEEEWLRV